MGMDVQGLLPSRPEGEYFGASVWRWRPLAQLLQELFPDETSGCTYWQSNDGDGLNATQSSRLAEALERAIGNGRVALWLRNFEHQKAGLPSRTCPRCNGVDYEDCSACNGTGELANIGTFYDLNMQKVKEFAVFLKHCGGFSIY